MNKKEFFDNLKICFKNIDLIDVEQKINKYITLLNEYNLKFNLTRLNDEKIIYKEYFYESIIPYKNINFNEIKNILDIGSGSGIPGFVLKILFPHIHLYIVESNSKKCLFLNELTKTLNLKNVFVNNERAEIYAHRNLNFFDLVTCRAVAELKIILELGVPCTKINGLLIFPKSINYLNELKNAKDIIDKLKINNFYIDSIEFNNKEFHTFIFKKEKDCDKLYPRSWKEIIK